MIKNFFIIMMILCSFAFAETYRDVSNVSYPHTASSTYSACYPYKVSDNIYNDVYYDAWQANGYSGWVAIELPVFEKVAKLSINRVYYRPKDIVFSGSIDNSTWTDLYSGTSPNDTGWITYDIANPGYYKYYRLNVLNTWWDYAIIYEWELLASEPSRESLTDPVPEPFSLVSFGLGLLAVFYAKMSRDRRIVKQ